MYTLPGHTSTVAQVLHRMRPYVCVSYSSSDTGEACTKIVVPVLMQVQFEPNDGYYMMTAGYDNTIKLWGASDFKLTNTLSGHEGKVMGADISPDGSGLVASVGYDRTIKFWGPGG